MEQYNITDVYSYAPRNLLSIEDIEVIFLNLISDKGNNYSEYSISTFYDEMNVSGEPLGAIKELLASDRKVAVIRKNQELTAIVGYTIKDAGEKG